MADGAVVSEPAGITVTLKGLNEGERPYVVIDIPLSPPNADAERILGAVFGRDLPVLVTDSTAVEGSK
jgi:hypothetical protein